MKDARFRNYLGQHSTKKTPLKEDDIPENPDKHIDQDFPGFPHGQSKEETINPKTKVQKKVAGLKTREPKTIIMDMPEVKDIPGQENIKPPHIREMMDITISSAGEEGEELLRDINKEDNDDIIMDKKTNVSKAEKKMLSKTDRIATEEGKDMKKLSLDKTDGKDLLNEESDPSDMGEGLDIPGAELDDEDEKNGEEDEENNSYSLPD